MIRGFIRWVCGADGLSIILHHMAEDERKRSSSRGISDRTVYEPRVATRRIESALLALGIITVLGVLGYMVFEGWSFADALYMTVITLTTVGYREVRVLDASGQLWTMLLLITGVGTLFYAAVSSVELVVEGTVRGYFGRRSVKAAIGRLNGHYILCGYGRVGKQVAREFAADDVPFVVVEQDQDILEECLAEGNLALLGEASDDEVLEEAGILRAGGLIAAVDSDADNVFVVLSARKLNPKLHIVARASSDESATKLEIAGPTVPSHHMLWAADGSPRSPRSPSSSTFLTSSRAARKASSSAWRSSSCPSIRPSPSTPSGSSR